MGMSAEDLQRKIANIEATISQAASASPYDQIRLSFGAVPASPYGLPRGGRAFAGPEEYVSNGLGQIMFKNGVIADLTSGQLIPGEWMNDPSITGSEAWLRDIQASWDESKVAEWRDRLSSQGFQVASSGGWARDLIDGLREYHAMRYLNYGEPLAMTPGGTGGIGKAIRDTLDRTLIRDTVKSWGDVVFDEPLDDDAADFWTDRMIDLHVKLAKQNPEWTVEQVQQGAQLRAEKEFTKSPGIKGTLREAEELEGSTHLRETMVSLSQVTGV